MAENELFGGIALDGDLSPYDYSDPISVLAADEIWDEGCLTDPFVSFSGLESSEPVSGDSSVPPPAAIGDDSGPLNDLGLANDPDLRHVSRKGTIAAIHGIEEIGSGGHELRLMICETAAAGKQRFFRAVAYKEDAIYLSERARTGDPIELDGVLTTTPWGDDWVDNGPKSVKSFRAAVLIVKFQLARAA